MDYILQKVAEIVFGYKIPVEKMRRTSVDIFMENLKNMTLNETSEHKQQALNRYEALKGPLAKAFGDRTSF